MRAFRLSAAICLAMAASLPSGGDGDFRRRMTVTAAAYAVPVLPSLRRTFSSAYLMPLPLYGSGGRSARIFAAVCAEQLLVDRPQGQIERGQRVFGARRLVDLGRDALGQVEDHRVREAEREVNLLALHLGAEADAADLERALEARGHALGHVGEDGAGQAVEARGPARVVVGRTTSICRPSPRP